MAFNSRNIPNDLIQSILEGKSIAFCGAGLSNSIKRTNGKTLPTWTALLKELLDNSISDNYKYAGFYDDIIKAISEDKLLMVAQEIEDTISKNDLTKYLRRIFLDRGLKPNDNHRSLVKIPFTGILTTNYDTLIEGAYTVQNEGRLPVVLTQEDLDKIPNPLRLKDEFVFKIHGDINRPETIVLSSHDYQNLLFRVPAYRSFLETLFTVNTVLFIGFGLSDPDVDNMLERLAGIYSRTNDYHYALVSKNKFSEFEKKRLAMDKRILTIEYDNSDGRHTEVLEFLRHLYEITSTEGRLHEEYEQKVTLKEKPIKKPSTPTVFLSYSGADKEKAKQIADTLLENGIDVWFDGYNVQVGDALVSTIKKGINEADYFLILLSKSSLNSQWVNQELELAFIKQSDTKSHTIIPVLLEKISVNKMPVYLRDILYLDLSENYSENINRLIRHIHDK